MKRTQDYIGEFEELVLLAIRALGTDAYGTTIIEALESAGRRVSIGALYATLARLEDKQLISSWLADPTSERGGRAKKYFKLNTSGIAAIQEAERTRRKLAPQLALNYKGQMT